MISQIDYDQISPDNSDQPTLIFIHGAGGDKKQWHYQYENFRTKGFGVLALSLPGHGKSYHSSSKSISDYVKEVYSLISQLNLRNFVLIGHSMGGGICLSYVLTYSNHPPTKLILIGTGAKLNVAPVFFELLSTDFNQALRLMGKFNYATATSVDIKQKNQDILAKNGPEILIQDLKTCQQFDVRDRLEETLPLDRSMLKSLPVVLVSLCEKLGVLAGEPIGNLVQNPKAEISLIRKLKDYSKKLSECAKSEAENDTSIAIYYAAIASALVFHDLRITKFSFESLNKAFCSLIDKPWMSGELITLFRKGLEVSQNKSKK